MEIIEVSYFGYEVEAWDSWRERIRLDSLNTNSLLDKLENGENLFNVIPGFTKEKLYNFRFKYGLFEERKEIVLDNERFYSGSGFTQVGKLLIPHFRIVSRDALEEKALNSDIHSPQDRERYVKALDIYSDANKFYDNLNEIVPLETEKFIVLDKSQLE